MLRINVVVVGGRIIGKTVSDRWNLSTLGIDAKTSQAAARRLCKALDCTLVVHRADQTISMKASKTEASSLGAKLARLFRYVA